jgi:hypothetical protein
MSVAEELVERPETNALLVPALSIAGFALTLYVFYPGVLSEDARYIYDDIARGFLGDWQSPVMTSLWSIIDPIAPGTASMFLLTTAIYWLGFGILAFKLAERSVASALVLLVLALSPPAFFFLSMVWRDVLFAAAWLLAAALCFAFTDRNDSRRRFVQAAALALLAFGVLLRPNAIPAAPVLGAYILWPTEFSLKRAALFLLPAAVGLFVLVQVVYYAALGAERQNIVHSIMVFDVGGITHFTQENQFPVSWSAAETSMLTSGCYQPADWSVYWTHGPCMFVMRRLDQEKIFGSATLVKAWTRAVWNHPVAYLRHRMAFMLNFLTSANSSLWTEDGDNSKEVFAHSRIFAALRAMYGSLQATPLFRPGSWLLASLAIVALAWRRRDTPAGAFAFGVCGSGALYILSFFPVGAGADFRYAYWAVLASLTGSVVIALGIANRPTFLGGGTR